MCDFCSWAEKFSSKTKSGDGKIDKVIPQRRDPVVVVHGGAGRIPAKYRATMLDGVKTAAIQAYTNLIRSSHALDAVEEAIRYMESQNYFNCAFGGSFNYNGDVVTDAGIMESSFQYGSVGAVRDIQHPISLARLVMHNTDHILIVEKGVQQFAIESGIPLLPPGSLIPEKTPVSSDDEEEEGEEEEEKEFGPKPARKGDEDSETEIIVMKRLPQCSPHPDQLIEEELSDTFEPTKLEIAGVGAVAYDRKGRLAAGTSTAGDQGKLNGYMSPAATVPGCGIFADPTGCVSISGQDQAIYAYAPSRKVVERLKREETIEEALITEIDRFQDTMGQSSVGAIALNSEGKPAVSFRSQHFPWAYCELGWVYYGCEKNQLFTEKIEGLDRPLDCMCEGVV